MWISKNTHLLFESILGKGALDKYMSTRQYSTNNVYINKDYLEEVTKRTNHPKYLPLLSLSEVMKKDTSYDQYDIPKDPISINNQYYQNRYEINSELDKQEKLNL